MDTITISAGAKTDAYMGDDGAFPATLVSIERKGPFDSKQEPGETYFLLEWGWAIEDEPPETCMVWGSSSESTGPKSKMYGILTALFGGKQPPVGTKLNIKTDLIGRMALVTVRTDDKGYKRADAVTPLPKAMQKGAAPKAAPVAQANPDNLPF